MIAPRREAELVGDAIARATIRTRGGSEAVRNLSGGNQQKVLLERWLLRKPRVLLLNDVTRGVDVGTKRQIYDVIAAIARLPASASSGIPPMRASWSASPIACWSCCTAASAQNSTGADVTVDRIVHAAVVGTNAGCVSTP